MIESILSMAAPSRLPGRSREGIEVCLKTHSVGGIGSRGRRTGSSTGKTRGVAFGL